MGSAAAHTADTTAIPSAPAAITAAALPRSIPPIATMGSADARPDGGKAIQPHRRRRVGLGRGGENRPDAQIVDHAGIMAPTCPAR